MEATISDKPTKVISVYHVFDSDHPEIDHVEINVMDPDDPGEVVTMTVPINMLLDAYKKGGSSEE